MAYFNHAFKKTIVMNTYVDPGTDPTATDALQSVLTSSVVMQRAIKAGRLSCMPFQTMRTPSYSACPDNKTGPVMLSPNSLIAAFSSSSSAPPSEIPRILVFASVATGAFFSQPGNIGMAAATLAASAVRQN